MEVIQQQQQQQQQQQPDLRSLVLENAKRSKSIFGHHVPGESATKRLRLSGDADPVEAQREKDALAVRFHAEYQQVQELPPALAQKQANALSARKKGKKPAGAAAAAAAPEEKTQKLIEGIPARPASTSAGASGPGSTALVKAPKPPGAPPTGGRDDAQSQALSVARAQATHQVKPDWHPPWKLMRVISGHLGWVRSLAVEPENQWFASGAGKLPTIEARLLAGSSEYTERERERTDWVTFR